jgi:hypothetical protein
MTIRWIDGKVVHHPTATIIAAHDGTDEAAIDFGEEEEVRIAGNFFENFFAGVGGAEVNACAGVGPEGDDAVVVRGGEGAEGGRHMRIIA